MFLFVRVPSDARRSRPLCSCSLKRRAVASAPLAASHKLGRAVALAKSRLGFWLVVPPCSVAAVDQVRGSARYRKEWRQPEGGARLPASATARPSQCEVSQAGGGPRPALEGTKKKSARPRPASPGNIEPVVLTTGRHQDASWRRRSGRRRHRGWFRNWSPDEPCSTSCGRPSGGSRSRPPAAPRSAPRAG